jgi:hypothetical protein
MNHLQIPVLRSVLLFAILGVACLGAQAGEPLRLVRDLYPGPGPGPGRGAQGGEPEANKGVKARIDKIYLAWGYMVMTSQHKEAVYRWSDKTVVIIEGKKGRISDLKVGDIVSARLLQLGESRTLTRVVRPSKD